MNENALPSWWYETCYSQFNPGADPRLTTRSEVSKLEALIRRVRYAADHPLKRSK